MAQARRVRSKQQCGYTSIGFRCSEDGDETERKFREAPSRGREFLIFVVKLLRAHGGCLGVRKL
jgi:hypothetical protein